MMTLGIDLASQAETTAAVAVRWEAGRASVVEVVKPCSDVQLDSLVTRADVIGIDAPLGWPLGFAAAVQEWTYTEWNPEIRDGLRFRLTDGVVRSTLGKIPLSVSTDAIALPAMRAMALLLRHGVTDRSGDGRIYEVYPAASLLSWGIRCGSYKDPKKRESKLARAGIIRELRSRLPWLELPDSLAEDADRLDALLAALSARCAAQGLTNGPDRKQRPIAKREGWIHVPNALPTL